MKLGGLAPIGTSSIICAGLLLAACNNISSGGLSSHQDGGRADSAGGSSAPTGSGGSKGSGGFFGNGGASGNGGGIASGGNTGNGGVTGKGGSGATGGVLASGGNTPSGGRIGSGGALVDGGVPSSGGNTPSGGALVGGGNSGSGGRIGGNGGAPGSGGALVGGGNSGSGGRGSGGASGSGGIQGTGGATTRDAAQDVNLECGPRTCGAGEYCCSASCGLCVPMGAMCVAIACLPDGGFGIDAGACRAVPTADALACGGTSPPHAYLCVLSTLPAPCVLRNLGNATDTYCCP